MALAFNHLSSCLFWNWSGKHLAKIPNSSTLTSSHDPASWESDNLKFPLVSSSRKVKRKWHSREQRKFDREYDVVLVPSDGGCVSGSESGESDYSVGWLEPHGPGFQSDDDGIDMDKTFAVLVPCYRHVNNNDMMQEYPMSNVLGAIVTVPLPYSQFNESKRYTEQWLSSI